MDEAASSQLLATLAKDRKRAAYESAAKRINVVVVEARQAASAC